jgi:hypothetical protein
MFGFVEKLMKNVVYLCKKKERKSVIYPYRLLNNKRPLLDFKEL